MMKNSNSKRTKQDKEQNKYHKITIGKVLFLIFSILLLLSLLTHNSQDDAVTEGGRNGHLFNWIGYFGAVFIRCYLSYFWNCRIFSWFFLFHISLKVSFQRRAYKKKKSYFVDYSFSYSGFQFYLLYGLKRFLHLQKTWASIHFPAAFSVSA